MDTVKDEQTHGDMEYLIEFPGKNKKYTPELRISDTGRFARVFFDPEF